MEVEQRDALQKQQEHLQQMQISNEITEKTTDKGLSLVEQTNYVINEELDPRWKEINQKKYIKVLCLKQTRILMNDKHSYNRTMTLMLH